MSFITLKIPEEFDFKEFLSDWTKNETTPAFFNVYFNKYLMYIRSYFTTTSNKYKYFGEKILPTISSFINSQQFKEDENCNFDYELEYSKPSLHGRHGKVSYIRENLCLKTKTDIENILGLQEKTVGGLKELIYRNEPIKLTISYNCSREKVLTRDLTATNNDLFDFIDSNLIQSRTPPPTTEIVLKLDDYYRFITTLFVLDPYHDFGRGFRNQKKCAKFCKTKKEMTDLKAEIYNFLKQMKEKLSSEYDSLRQYHFLNKQKPITNLNTFFDLFPTTSITSGYEGSILEHLRYLSDNNTINQQNITNGKLFYSNTQNELIDLRGHNHLVYPKYISNNAISIKNDIVYYMSPNCEKFTNNPNTKRKSDASQETTDISFGGTISNSCKSLPATLYDGCDSGHCGNLSSNLRYGSGLEIGCYNIKFKFDDANYTQFESIIQKSSSVIEPSGVIEQKITIRRSVQKPSSKGPTTYEAQFIYPIIAKDKFVIDNVTVDDELEQYFSAPSSLYGFLAFRTTPDNIKFGTLLKTHGSLLDVDVIHTSRKALCDFGQYLNGMLKTGGYYGNIVQNKNTVTPGGYFYDGVSSIDLRPHYITKLPLNKNYPFLAMHGDQPAAALNMFLLSVIPQEIVNNYSHMVYGTDGEFVFANYQGRITQVPIPQQKGGDRSGRVGGKRMTGGNGGDDYKNDKLLGEMYNTLFDFFYLCISFEMEQSEIYRYNIFCSEYLKKSDLTPFRTFTSLRISNAQSASPRSLITSLKAGVLNEKRCKTHEEIIANFSDPNFIKSYENIKDIVDKKMGEILNEETDAVAQGVDPDGVDPDASSVVTTDSLSNSEVNNTGITTRGSKSSDSDNSHNVGEKILYISSDDDSSNSSNDSDEIKVGNNKKSFIGNKGGSKNKTRKMNKKQKKNRKTKSKRRYLRKTSKHFTKFKSSSSSNKKTRKV